MGLRQSPSTAPVTVMLDSRAECGGRGAWEGHVPCWNGTDTTEGDVTPSRAARETVKVVARKAAEPGSGRAVRPTPASQTLLGTSWGPGTVLGSS